MLSKLLSEDSTFEESSEVSSEESSEKTVNNNELPEQSESTETDKSLISAPETDDEEEKMPPLKDASLLATSSIAPSTQQEISEPPRLGRPSIYESAEEAAAERRRKNRIYHQQWYERNKLRHEMRTKKMRLEIEALKKQLRDIQQCRCVPTSELSFGEGYAATQQPPRREKRVRITPPRSLAQQPRSLAQQQTNYTISFNFGDGATEQKTLHSMDEMAAVMKDVCDVLLAKRLITAYQLTKDESSATQ